MKKSELAIPVMAFYHEDGLVPAWKQATEFAGKNGRIATMPDVVNARIATGLNEHPWHAFYTTTTAEYLGYSRGGNRILIVAHGVGPMSTLEGIQKAYSHEYKDNAQRRNRGGRISEQQFRNLEDGKYGDVHIIEFDPIVARYKHPFMGYLNINEAIAEPLLLARLGPRADEYLNHHARMAIELHKSEHRKDIFDPCIVEMGAPSNCFYLVGGWEGAPLRYPYLDKGDGPLAHLISTGALCNVHHEKERRVPYSLANDVGCHEWWNGVRLVAVRENAVITDIHPGVKSVRDLILKHWTFLMEKIEDPILPNGFHILTKGSDVWFTQYPKKGARMDSYDPEFQVTKIKKIGEQTEFIATIGGYHGFFKYGIKEVYAIKPVEANAYATVGEPTIIYKDGDPTHHRIDVQFYHVEVDTTQRLIHQDTLRNDYDKLMMLLRKDVK